MIGESYNLSKAHQRYKISYIPFSWWENSAGTARAGQGSVEDSYE